MIDELVINCICDDEVFSKCKKQSIDIDCLQCRNVVVEDCKDIYVCTDSNGEIADYVMLDSKKRDRDRKLCREKNNEAYDEYIKKIKGESHE